ncbi:MAG: NAD-binding protein [Kineosporiaceae bacterium]
MAEEAVVAPLVLVHGLHGVGVRVVEQLLAASVRVVVLWAEAGESGAGVGLEQVRRLGADVHRSGPDVAAALIEAGLDEAVAVIVAEADDLHTLGVALRARECRPDVRVVAQMRNPAVGRALAAVDIAVVDVARLAAPAVVEACLGTGVHVLELGGERFVVGRLQVAEATTLRQGFGALAPVTVVDGRDQSVTVCPGRDLAVRPGDVVTVLGTPEEVARHGLSTATVRRAVAADAVAAGARYRGHREGPAEGTLEARLRHLVGSLVQAVDARMWAALGCLALLVAGSTLVLRLNYREPDGRRMSVVDAVYFTVETIGTIGYGDFSFREQSTGLRLFAIALMILGAALATVFFAMMTNLVVSRRIAESMGRRRATTAAGHVIVVGLGSIGARVVQGLRAAGAEVVVLDRDPGGRYAGQVRDAGVTLVAGDATAASVLDGVGLSRAGAVAVLTSDDLTNVEIGLAVRDQLGPRWADVPVVLRLFDRDLADTVRASFGFAHVRSTAALAAPWFVGAAFGLDVQGTFYGAGVPMLVASLRVGAQGRLDGVAMQDLPGRVRVVAIARASGQGRLEHPPRRGTRLAAGDLAYLIGPYEDLLGLLLPDVEPVKPAANGYGRAMTQPVPPGPPLEPPSPGGPQPPLSPPGGPPWEPGPDVDPPTPGPDIPPLPDPSPA